MPTSISPLLSQELLFALAIALLITESIAWLIMPRWYFDTGIPLFQASTKALNWPTSQGVDALLAEHQPQSAFAPFKFRQIDQTLIAFRESMAITGFWKWSYTPMMRGALKIDRAERTVTLHGYASYSLLLLVPAATMHNYSRSLDWLNALATFMILTLVLGGLYVIQMIRYQKLIALCSFVRQP